MPSVPSFLHAHFERLARSALDWTITIGVIPIVLMPHVIDGQLVPVVPQPEMINLFVGMDDYGQREYSATWNNKYTGPRLHSSLYGCTENDAMRSTLMVWAGGEYLPLKCGKLVTPITHLEDGERFLSILRENLLIASVISSNPPLVSVMTQHKNNDTDGVIWNVDDETIRAAETSRLTRVAESTREQFELHKERWADGGLPTTNEQLRQFRSRCEPKEYFLANERQLVRQAEPSFPSYYTEMAKQCDERIYQIFGIPYGLFSNQGTHANSDYMQIYSLNSHMKCMKDELQAFLQAALRLCQVTKQGTKVTKRDSEHVAKKRKASTTLFENCPSPSKTDVPFLVDASEQELENEKRMDINHVDVPYESPLTLPGIVCCERNDIVFLKNEGYISNVEACNLARQMIGLGPLDVSTVEKQISHTKLEDQGMQPKREDKTLDAQNGTRRHSKTNQFEI